MDCFVAIAPRNDSIAPVIPAQRLRLRRWRCERSEPRRMHGDRWAVDPSRRAQQCAPPATTAKPLRGGDGAAAQRRCTQSSPRSTLSNSRRDMRSRSRGALRPRDAIKSPSLTVRGRREGRAPIAPMGPVQQKAREEGPQVKPKHPAFPARWVTAYFVLFPVRPGLLVTDFAKRISISRGGTCHWGARTTRLHRPPISACRRAPPASIASRRTFVTIAIRPSCRAGRGKLYR
ncbi:hypothetical protein ACVIGB_006772 [Bradyrhizobium sp. USDA 4341]